MNNTYTLTVFNTCTNQYEEIEVTKAVYDEYRRGEWRIDKKDDKTSANVLSFSELIGGENGEYENFREFIDLRYSPESLMLHAEEKNVAYEALKCLTAVMRRRYLLHYEAGLTIKQIAEKEGVSEYSIKDSIDGARIKIATFLEKFWK